jgi:myo-inositol 2-dehydrogenase / D-chiro-inositol 1-dehydrogenase
MNQSIPSKNTSGPIISRRRFLGGTLAAGAAVSSFGPLGGRAAEPAAATPIKAPEFNRKIKLGVVGCGGRGSWIAKLFQKHGGYEMFAVADYFPGVADACGEALGVDKTRRFSGLSGYQRLMDSGVEAVALETPPCFFPEHTRAAVGRKLHVYMAKPIAADVPGCLEVEAAATRATAGRRVFLVDYQLPTEPHNIEVVKLIRAGEIGKVVALNSHYYAGTFSDPPRTDTIESRLRSLIWCNDVAIGGGYHVNACIHGVDAALWVAGQRPVAAMGLSRVGRPEPHGDSHDVFELVLEFPDGVLMSHRGEHLNNQLGFDVICQVIGTTGYAQTCYGGKTTLRGPENRYEGEVPNPYEAGAVRNIAKFYDCVTGDNFSNDTVARSVDGALATILGREAARRRTHLTMEELLKEKSRLEVDLRGLKT